MEKKGAERNLPVSDSEANLLPDDLVVLEVIKRLPIKNVIRCKSVSKAWCSMIEQPNFAEAYSDRNPCTVVFSLGNSKRLFYYFCYPSLEGCGQYAKRLRLLHPENIKDVFRMQGVIRTPIINGIFASGNYYDRRVFICNVFTGETMRLPDLPAYPNPNPNPNSNPLINRYCDLNFGYDPVNRVYKLLYTNGFDRSINDHRQFDILTIGKNSSWKKLTNTERPDVGGLSFYSYGSTGSSICVNGILYWFQAIEDYIASKYLRFLNLSEEKISYCYLPEDITLPLSYKLVQFRGRLSLIHCRPTYAKPVTLYTLEDNRGHWTRHDLPLFLPRESSLYKLFRPHSLPTGELLLVIFPAADFSGPNLYYAKPIIVSSYHYKDETKFRILLQSEEIHNVGKISFCGAANMAKLDTLFG